MGFDVKKIRERWAKLPDKYKPPIDELAEEHFDLMERYEDERKLWIDTIRVFEEELRKRAGD